MRLYENPPGISQSFDSLVPGLDGIYPLPYNGIFAYDPSSWMYKALLPAATNLENKQKLRDAKENLDVGKVNLACEHYFEETKILFAKLGKVILYVCKFEEKVVGWVDVKEQVGRLNGECVHGQVGMTGMYESG